VTGFSLSAQQIADLTRQYFPDADIRYVPTEGRQRIVDSWPAELDDSAARKDWGWSPVYDSERAFAEYLIPTIRALYT
jgi:threonine 3-dehydrogenase